MIKVEEIGGYNPAPNQNKWPAGSIFANEGKKIYDIIRKYKPNTLLEIGAYYGCSTAYIAAAVRDNGKGKFVSVDSNKGSHSLLPEELKKYVEIVHEDAYKYKFDGKVDFLFEDGAHTEGFTSAMIKRFNPGIVVQHDYMHVRLKSIQQKEFKKAVGEPDEVFFEPPTDCGLAIKYINTNFKSDATKERLQPKDYQKEYKETETGGEKQKTSGSNSKKYSTKSKKKT